MLWDPGVRYLVCETHSHLQDWISSFSVLLVGLSRIDYVSVPFHLLQCMLLVQYEFGDSFVILAKRERVKTKAPFVTKVQSCLRTCTALSPPYSL